MLDSIRYWLYAVESNIRTVRATARIKLNVATHAGNITYGLELRNRSDRASKS